MKRLFGSGGSSKLKAEAATRHLKPIIEGPLLVMQMVDGGKDVDWDTRHATLYANARVELYMKQGDRAPASTETLTGDHFVADAAGVTNGWQISDFESVVYLACGSPQEKTFWMHAVAGVIRRLMEPMDALPPQYAKVQMRQVDAAAAASSKPPLPPRRPSEADPPPPRPRHGGGVVVVEVPPDRVAPVPPLEEDEDTEVVAQLRKELDLAQTQLAEARAARAVAEGDQAVVVAEATKARTEAEALKQERDFAVEEAARRASTAAEAEAEKRQLETQVAEARAKVAALEEQSRAALAVAKQQVEAEHKRVLEAATVNSDAAVRASLDAANSALASANAARDAADASAQLLKTRVAALEAQVAGLSKAEAEAKRLAGEAVTLRASVESTKMAAAKAQADFDAERREVEAALARAKRDLSEEKMTKEAEMKTLKAETTMMLARRSVRIGGGGTTTPTPPPPPKPKPVSSKPLSPPLPPTVLPPKVMKEHIEAGKRGSILEQQLVVDTKSLWAKRIAAGREEQKTNVFSKHFDPGATKGALTSKGEDGYGKPPPGSATEARWAKGKQWVEDQISGLLAVIRDIGTAEADGTVTVQFGLLFYTYADISDSLVGVMMRAKKRKLLYYEGDMLFQSKDDEVIITLPNAK